MKAKISLPKLAALVSFAFLLPPAFANDATLRSYTLSWTPPTRNEDGTPLTDLWGYYIYAGDSPDNLAVTYFMGSQSPRIDLRFLATSTRYYAVSAVNVDGVEGPLSAIVSDSTH